MRRRELHLSPEMRAELERVRSTERRAYLREAASGLLKVADGYSAHWVALYGLSRSRKPDTVYGWLSRYRVYGLEGLVHKPRGHRGFSPSRRTGPPRGDPPSP
jgi:hypothetical protein